MRSQLCDMFDNLVTTLFGILSRDVINELNYSGYLWLHLHVCTWRYWIIFIMLNDRGCPVSPLSVDYDALNVHTCSTLPGQPLLELHKFFLGSKKGCHGNILCIVHQLKILPQLSPQQNLWINRYNGTNIRLRLLWCLSSKHTGVSAVGTSIGKLSQL